MNIISFSFFNNQHGKTTTHLTSPDQHQSLQTACQSFCAASGQIVLPTANLSEFRTDSCAAKPRAEVEESFRVLRNNDKWILFTGIVVEDNLYAFGKLQIGDHPSQSLIFDPGDSELYIKNDVSTEEEIKEIKAYKIFKPIQLPDDIKQSTADIRKALNEKQSWEECYDREKHFDLDWIKHSVYTLVREYENGSLKKDHLENWYNIHIWCIVNYFFEYWSFK